jgi:hypothetical protein
MNGPGLPGASGRVVRRTTRVARGAVPRPGEVAPTVAPSTGRVQAQPAAEAGEPIESGWLERILGYGASDVPPPSIGEADPYYSWRKAREQGIIRDVLPPGVPLETAPRPGQPPPAPGQPWPGRIPGGPQPIGRRPMPDRVLLRWLLTSGGL